MTIQITVPALGESVTEATIAKWHKRVGDVVKADELIVELETEKVTLEVNAPAGGILVSITQDEGTTVKINDTIGTIQEGATVASTTVSATIVENNTPPNANPPSYKEPTSILSPSARKIATEQGMNVSSIVGSGKDGRITKGDVLASMVVPPPPTVSQTAVNPRNIDRIKMSRLRKTIAQRLKDSQNTAAILTTFNEIDMSNVIALRQRYREQFEKKHNIKLGFMSFFIKAAISALKELPTINAEIEGEDILYKNYYDIGVAVGTEQGLVVPVLKDADKMSFANIEATIADLGKKARVGKLSIAELSGGTFSITNGGIYGSLMSTPIINPPQSGILAMHKTMDRPIAVDGKIEIRPMMYIALSYDHRIIDGREAVTFLVKVKEAVENPERLLLEI